MPQVIHCKPRRFCVTYEEDCQNGLISTFGVDANSAAEATGKVIAFIEDKNLHQSKEYGYTLIPRISKQKTDYNIPYKSNQEI